VARPILVAGVSTLVLVCARPPATWAAAPSPSPLASTPEAVAWSQFQHGAEHGGEASASVKAPLRQSWRATAPGTGSGRGTSGAVIVGDLAIALNAEHVFAANLSTGSMDWQLGRDKGSISMPAVGVSGRRDVLVYTEGATTSNAAVVAVDVADRTQLWRESLKGVSNSGVTISDGDVFLGDRSGNLYGFSLQDGSPLWSPIGLAGGSIDAPPAASSSALVVTERNHDNGSVKIDAVDPATGKGLWSYSAGVSAGTATVATLDERNAVFGIGGEQRVRALGLTSKGAAITSWSTHTRSTFSPLSSAAEADGKVFIVSTTASDAAVYALNASDGAKLWDFQFQEPAIETSPIVIGNTVYVGTDDGLVAGIDIASGLLIWQAETGPGAIGPLAAGDDELIASKRGSRGGFIAFRTDPSGTRLQIESPTKLHLGTVVVRYAIALVVVFAVVYGGVLLLRRLRPDIGSPPAEEAAVASAPPEPEEP
jgi:outer membrane protein assembly factor BamB